MEARDYLKLYLANRRLILIMMAIATGVTLAVTALQPVQSMASISFAVNRINPEVTPDYQYDGYYALQATELFSQTVVSWFSTPSFLRDVYAEAKLEPEITSLNSLASRFSVKRYSPQNIVVRLNERDQTRVEKLARALPIVLNIRTDRLNQDPSGKPLFEIIAGAPVIAPNRPPVAIAGALALVLSFGLSLFVVSARHYLR